MSATGKAVRRCSLSRQVPSSNSASAPGNDRSHDEAEGALLVSAVVAIVGMFIFIASALLF